MPKFPAPKRAPKNSAPDVDWLLDQCKPDKVSTVKVEIRTFGDQLTGTVSSTKLSIKELLFLVESLTTLVRSEIEERQNGRQR